MGILTKTNRKDTCMSIEKFNYLLIRVISDDLKIDHMFFETAEDVKRTIQQEYDSFALTYPCTDSEKSAKSYCEPTNALLYTDDSMIRWKTFVLR